MVSKFAPKCTWFKEKNEVSESTRHKVEVQQIKDGEFAVQLEISQVSDTDKGSYQLIAKNEKGEAVSQIVELVDIPTADEEEKAVKPIIVKKLVDQTVEETRTLELNVSLKRTVDKKSKVVWYQGAKVIGESTKIKQTFDGKTATLRISKTKSNEHSGTYKCVIKNEAGEDETTASITVKKVEEKKKKKEEENVEETIQVEEEQEQEEKKGPFDVKLKKAQQNKTVISVSCFSNNFFCRKYIRIIVWYSIENV